jgi:hypothetical protein
MYQVAFVARERLRVRAGWAGYHEGRPLGIYLPMILLAAAVATVSAAHGIQATRSPAAA